MDSVDISECHRRLLLLSLEQVFSFHYDLPISSMPFKEGQTSHSLHESTNFKQNDPTKAKAMEYQRNLIINEPWQKNLISNDLTLVLERYFSTTLNKFSPSRSKSSNDEFALRRFPTSRTRVSSCFNQSSSQNRSCKVQGSRSPVQNPLTAT